MSTPGNSGRATLGDLLALWQAWNSDNIVDDAARRAEAAGDTEQADKLRALTHRGPSAVAALAAQHELTSLLDGWRWHTMLAAREQGATWDDIAAATSMAGSGDPEEARAEFLARIERARDAEARFDVPFRDADRYHAAAAPDPVDQTEDHPNSQQDTDMNQDTDVDTSRELTQALTDWERWPPGHEQVIELTEVEDALADAALRVERSDDGDGPDPDAWAAYERLLALNDLAPPPPAPMGGDEPTGDEVLRQDRDRDQRSDTREPGLLTRHGGLAPATAVRGEPGAETPDPWGGDERVLADHLADQAALDPAAGAGRVPAPRRALDDLTAAQLLVRAERADNLTYLAGSYVELDDAYRELEAVDGEATRRAETNGTGTERALAAYVGLLIDDPGVERFDEFTALHNQVHHALGVPAVVPEDADAEPIRSPARARDLDAFSDGAEGTDDVDALAAPTPPAEQDGSTAGASTLPPHEHELPSDGDWDLGPDAASWSAELQSQTGHPGADGLDGDGVGDGDGPVLVVRRDGDLVTGWIELPGGLPPDDDEHGDEHGDGPGTGELDTELDTAGWARLEEHTRAVADPRKAEVSGPRDDPDQLLRRAEGLRARLTAEHHAGDRSGAGDEARRAQLTDWHHADTAHTTDTAAGAGEPDQRGDDYGSAGWGR